MERLGPDVDFTVNRHVGEIGSSPDGPTAEDLSNHLQNEGGFTPDEAGRIIESGLSQLPKRTGKLQAKKDSEEHPLEIDIHSLVWFPIVKLPWRFRRNR